MKLIEQLVSSLADGRVIEVRIGLHWTATVVEVEGRRRCGLASTITADHPHGTPDVPQAGQLEAFTGLELAELALAGQPTLSSIGVAAINALLVPQPETWVDINAEDVIIAHGQGKKVALIGHFPFPNVKSGVRELSVIEQNPQPGEYPPEAAPDILPLADVVAITGMTLINHTLEDLLKLCSPDATILVLGPSTPLTPLMYDWKIDLLAGSVVERIGPVLHFVSQGACFRQIKKAGVRLVTMARPGLKVR
jgi:uncharacterized protein (DUF4213/DUF364 family)